MTVQAAAEIPSEERVVEVINPSGRSPVVLVCEHASNCIPAHLGGLGVPDEVIASHVAWDPGALTMAQEMSEMLDAPLVAPRISRLVYDCNRPPGARSAVPVESEIYAIPGNRGLSRRERQARAAWIYTPFRQALEDCLERRLGSERAVVIVTVQSFTPTYGGVKRDLEIGILHDADSRLADRLLAVIEAEGAFLVRRNAPYGPEDGVTHTLATHALPRGLLNVMLEVRNDLIADTASQGAMARHLTGYLRTALAEAAEN